MPGPVGHEPLADIGAGTDRHAQAVAGMLVDEAQFGTQQTAALGFIQAVDIQYLAVSCRVVDIPGGRFQTAGKHVQQRALAGAGFAHDAEDFPGPQIQRNVLAADAAAVTPRQLAGGKDGIKIGIQEAHGYFSSLGAAVPPCPATRRAQLSVSEQTNMRVPASSMTISSR